MNYVNLCLLAKSTTWNQFLLIAYIVFLSETDLPYLKTISQHIYRFMLSPQNLWLHCNTKSAELNGLDAQKTS